MNRTFYLDDVNRTVNFIFDFNKDIADRIKAMDHNARWNKEHKQWIVPVNEFTKYRILEFIKKENFQQINAPIEEEVVFSYEKNDIDYAYLKGLCDSKDFSYSPRKYQLQCLGYSLDKKNLIIGDDVGLGKCEYVKNRVYTPYGREEIGKIKKGDYVIGSDGKPTKVLETHPQNKSKALYRVTFSDNSQVLVSEDHLFTVESHTRSKKRFTLTVSQLMNKEGFVISRGLGHNKNKEYKCNTYYKSKFGVNRWKIPMCQPIQFETRATLPIDPYLLGLALGDAHINKYGYLIFDIGAQDFDELLGGYDFKESKSKNNKRKGVFYQYGEPVRKVGLAGKKSHEKFIPDIYKYAKVEDRLALLQGLMDSDGYVSKDQRAFQGTEYCSVSKRLAYDVRDLVETLGGVARLRTRKSSYVNEEGGRIKCKDSYRLNIKLREGMNPFKLKRKASLYNYPKKYKIARYIKDIKFERYDEAVCISVEAQDKLYLTEHAIVTHNTFEAIMYAEVTNSFPCLVVTPASVKYNWAEKWAEITKNKQSISVIESRKNNNWDSNVIVINYDILGKKQGTGVSLKFPELDSINWSMIICDEAHFLKEKKAQRSQAVKRIIDKNDFKIQLLTGTAINSRPAELWNLLVLCKTEKKIANDWMHYVRRYCGAYRGKFGWVTEGATNTMELNEKLRETCYIRREKADVLKELPEINVQVIQAPITNKKKIDRAKEDFIAYVQETKGADAADKAMEAEHLVAIGELRKLAIEGKLKAIEQYLKDWKPSGKKLLIFGIHKDPLKYLSGKFKSKLISGGVSSIEKQSIIKGWCENDDVFLFANMQSAGTGVDGLQEVCSEMLILELPWKPSEIDQVIGRLNRSGQKFSTNVNYMLNFDSIDSSMWNMLQFKKRVTEAVNKGKDVRKSQSNLQLVIKNICKS